MSLWYAVGILVCVGVLVKLFCNFVRRVESDPELHECDGACNYRATPRYTPEESDGSES